MRPAILALLIAAALAASGCGQEHTTTTTAATASSSSPVVDAAVKTAATGGVRLTAHGRAAILGAAAPVDATGAFDLRRRSGRFTATTAVAGRPVRIDGIAAGNAVYLHSDALAGRLPAGRRWLRVDLGKVLQGVDPARTLRALRDAGGVRRGGRATVGGVATTRYTGTAHGARFAVWIGDDGLVHRARVTSGRGNLTVTLSGFGVRVTARAPAAHTVFDATGLVRSLTR